MLLGLAALAGLIIIDILSYMLLGGGFFNLWVVKLTIGAAMAGAIVYGIILHRREKKSRQLELLLPGFIAARRAWFERRAAEDREFQTFCHECRHFDHQRLRCLLRLQERQTRIKLQNDGVFSYCLYWNLEDRHPLLQLTERVSKPQGEGKEDGSSF